MPEEAAIVDLLRAQRALPLFHCGDAATGMRVLETLNAGGFLAVEFLNRSAGAVDVFRELAAAAAERLPGMVLGAGTIVDTTQVEAFRAAGAAFIVAPNLDEEVGRSCAALGIPWCPGSGTVSEMMRARRLGAAVIKVFPADALGGPAFIRAVRGPCPDLRLMPSGGVTLDAANLAAWFEAGVFCVGIGSSLIDASVIAEGRFAELADRVQRLRRTLAAV